MNPNNTEKSFASTTEQEVNREKEPTSEEGARKMGNFLLVRVMHLEGHDGIQSRDEESIVYTVDNQQYPDQGDFAFSGDSALEKAVDRGFPNNLSGIHIMEVDPGDVVEPNPDDAPGVVYVKNGATARAYPVPRDVIDQQIDRAYAGEPSLTAEEVIDNVRES